MPQQRSPRTAPDAEPVLGPRVTVFHDGTHWSYRVEGEPDPGHLFADLSPALAGAGYLARTLRAELVVLDTDGAVCERAHHGEACRCHPHASPNGAGPGV